MKNDRNQRGKRKISSQGASFASTPLSGPDLVRVDANFGEFPVKSFCDIYVIFSCASLFALSIPSWISCGLCVQDMSIVQSVCLPLPFYLFFFHVHFSLDYCVLSATLNRAMARG